MLAFQTTDPPQAVFTFYKDQLTRMHWKTTFPIGNDKLLLLNEEACPLYNIEITATLTNTVRTDVVLEVAPGLCQDR